MDREDIYKNSVYNFFKTKSLSPRKAIGYVTDKQYVFESRNFDRYLIHNDMITSIDNLIYDDNGDRSRDNNVYVYMYKDDSSFLRSSDFMIVIPEGELTMAQYTFICSILDEIDKYNLEVSSSRKIDITVAGADDNFVYGSDAQYIKSIIERMISRDIKIDEEQIIGRTLSDVDQMMCLLFHINLKACKTVDDLVHSMKICELYYQDSYYHDLFNDMFPDYIKIKNLINSINELNIEDISLEGLTYDNMYKFLSEIFNNYSSKKMTGSRGKK